MVRKIRYIENPNQLLDSQGKKDNVISIHFSAFPFSVETPPPTPPHPFFIELVK
jgi:hypothetical protein